jgi:hypothetical protein
MAHLTTEQATELVNNGHCMCRCIDGVYSFHQFTGSLDGDSYLLQSPTEVDLALDETSTEEECKNAFVDWFENNCDYKGVAPVVDDSNVW